MIVHTLAGPVPGPLERALEEFERQFWYPLGGSTFFRISHCGLYCRFFEAMGEAACFVAEAETGVVGVLGTAVRRLTMPGGHERRVGYIGDLKIAPGSRGGLVLARLARAAHAWLRARVDAAIGIAMDGTNLLPTQYTGRAGLPGFAPAGGVTILRLPAGGTRRGCKATPEQVAALFRQFSAKVYALPVENAALRSRMQPVPLANDGACGLLEDTLLAKRLFLNTGEELLSAHLSSFAYVDQLAAIELLDAARALAAERGFDAVFVAADADLAKTLNVRGPQVATATIFTANLEPGEWRVNTAEI